MVPAKLYLVVPCFREQEVLPLTGERLMSLFDALTREGKIMPESRILLVDDGSDDGTWDAITALHTQDERFLGLRLAHNVGHMRALWAGMETAVSQGCDCLVTIDADLQDDPEAIRAFLKEYADGCDVVYGVRSQRKTDTFFKRFTARAFYRLMSRMGAETVYDHADYRLLSRRAAEGLLGYPEVNLYLRGMVPLLGFKSAKVPYERGERAAGESKYPLKKMVSLAVEGVTSFSDKPIRMVLAVGVLFALIGIGMLIYTLVSRLSGHSVRGWASLMTSLWLIGGVQLIALGVIGEYIGRIYMEVKRRPKYLVREKLL